MRIIKRVEIEVQKQAVFKLGDPFNLSQVARLESRVEEDCAVSYVSDVDWVVLELQIPVLHILLYVCLQLFMYL